MNIQQLRERYAEPEIPKCRVCGGELTIQRAGGGPTTWGCTGMIDDPTGERNWVYAEGRECADEHYGRSRWSDYRQGGDADVIELIDALEAAEEEIARRDAAASEPVGVIRENPDDIGLLAEFEVMPPLGAKLYTAAPPAVLPVVTDLAVELLTAALIDGADAKTALKLAAQGMGAQPQKPVVLPEPHAHLIWIQAGRGPDDYWDDVEVSRSDKDRCCDGSERYAVYSEFEVKAMLDAANIPYEVKP